MWLEKLSKHYDRNFAYSAISATIAAALQFVSSRTTQRFDTALVAFQIYLTAYLAGAVSPLFQPCFEIQTQPSWDGTAYIKLNNNGGFGAVRSTYAVETRLCVAAAYVDVRDIHESMRHSADFMYLHWIKSNLPHNRQQSNKGSAGTGRRGTAEAKQGWPNKNKQKWRRPFSCSCL